MWDPQSDPLGNALKGRARDFRFNLAAEGLQSPIGPLPDPQWDGFFQAVNESAGGKRVRYAQDTNDDTNETYANPAAYQGLDKGLNSGTPFDMQPMGPSEQLGTLSVGDLTRRKHLALKGIR